VRNFFNFKANSGGDFFEQGGRGGYSQEGREFWVSWMWGRGACADYEAVAVAKSR